MKVKRAFLIFLVMGTIYIFLEVLTRAVRMDLVGFQDLKSYSLAGWTSLWMLPIGGLSGLMIGMLNEGPKRHMALMCLFGAMTIFCIEFSSGMVFNVLLKMNIWDYSKLPLNILGQISLVYFIPWFFICPFAMWLDDAIRYVVYDADKPSKLSSYYLNIFRKEQR